MAKRIIELNDIQTRQLKTDGGKQTGASFVATDRTETDDGSGTYKITVKGLIGSVIGGPNEGVPDYLGGGTIDWILGPTNSNNNSYLRLSPKVQVPASPISVEPGLGGRINLWMQDYANHHSRAVLDIKNDPKFTDTGGVELYPGQDWFRILLSASDDGPYYAGLVIHRQTGKIYRSQTPNNPYTLVPLGGDNTFDDTHLVNKDNDLQDQINALKTGGCHVGEVPPTGPGSGSLWWDTNTATLYVWVNTGWVVANPNANYVQPATSEEPETPVTPEPVNTAGYGLIGKYHITSNPGSGFWNLNNLTTGHNSWTISRILGESYEYQAGDVFVFVDNDANGTVPMRLTQSSQMAKQYSGNNANYSLYYSNGVIHQTSQGSNFGRFGILDVYRNQF